MAAVSTLRLVGTNRRDQAKAATRAKVIDGARFLFSNAGYFSTSIRDIADRIGMSTGAVFANVSDKAALWRLAMGGPAPSEGLAEEVALVQALRPGWGWVLRFNGAEHIAALTPPHTAALALPASQHYSGRGASPAEALRQARISAERGDADRLRDNLAAVQ
jgi:AcrR family transcriptional regulator